MKNSIIFTTIFALGLSAQTTLAKGQDRGGGDAVVCRDTNRQITKITLLDYFEAQTMTSLSLDLGNGSTYQEKIQFVLQRLESIDPLFAQTLRSFAENFESLTAFVMDGDVATTRDATISVNPSEGCAIERFAANKLNPLPFEKKILVSNRLWQLADSETKAGLILHEAIYIQAQGFGETNSDHSRYFNALIASKNILSSGTAQAPQDYAATLEKLGWNKCSGKFSILVKGIEFYADCHLMFNPIDSSVQIGGVVKRTVFHSSLGPLTVAPDTQIRITKDGVLVQAKLDQPTLIPMGSQKLLLPANSSLYFKNDGKLKEVKLLISA